MKKIDSQALGILNKALGLTGAGSPLTELTDGVVDQVVEVGPIARRSQTQGVSTGLYIGVLENDHGGATTLSTSVFPYNIGATAVLPPYPNPMPAQFDVWLLAATMARVAGTGTVTAALSCLYASTQQGFGLDDAGAATGIVTMQLTFAFWDALTNPPVGLALLRNEGPLAHLNLRLPRDAATQVRFTSVASAAATYRCFLILGVFPVALGQDGAF